jgi:hypothetical protein
MNKKQRVVILIGIVIIAMMLLVPPYRYYLSGNYDGGHAGYGLIFSPDERLLVTSEGIMIRRSSAVQLDLATLFVQCFLVGVLTSGVVFLLHNRKP